ncbi:MULTISPECIES: DUF1326 domain-containing protein [Pseudomonas]|jgi:hypothetical protein|uniref:DUF1326 domain-containing protein n=1 Tax=Pseudomonas monteilii SB3101 TaxID=1435058 RepID=V9UXJ3_9PSED|nr:MULTISPECIES: DUF1326 domain-containing protein [Pseudomonas]AHC82014.1 hypothetical protein X969_08560 [Pseudomonas monteilii SB3078]AHC87391.1 hypothetical protein X970_08220 [Pseudomonas monteilii SB3101]KAF4557188.1 DUF1326 domain-containing protein [Pseudomonas sp. CES]KGK25086.1 hypothetical protein GT93_09630 [Pseudomonas plecoglossicida]MDD1985345.1 DUF1326 domain-containing protein [Pseudomonas asiatica]
MAYVDWRLRGAGVDLCNCDYGCPCQFNALPTHGTCEAAVGYHIEEGYFDEVSLAGLNVACTFAWPGPIHEGGGQCQAFIDERANDAQRQALLTILSGQEQEPTAFFAIFASTVQTMHAPQFVPVEVHTDRAALTASIHVPGVLDGRAEPIRNPVDGSVHRARLVLPQGFEFGETDCASATFNCSGAVKLDYAGRNAMLYDLDMGPNGIIRG